MTFHRFRRRMIPVLLLALSFLPSISYGQNDRKVTFRLLCFEHREGVTSARIDVGGEPGKFQEMILLTGNFTDEYKVSFPDNIIRFHVADPARPDGRRIVAEGPLAQGDHQLFLLLPESNGTRPYRVYAMNDEESVFPMGGIRVLNLCPSQIRFNLAGAEMKPIEPGKIVVYPPILRFDEWGMYQVRIDLASADGDWIPVSSPSWKASKLKRDLIITMLDPVAQYPRISYYKDIPPWRKPKPGLQK
jgi:hypothetical protein